MTVVHKRRRGMKFSAWCLLCLVLLMLLETKADALNVASSKSLVDPVRRSENFSSVVYNNTNGLPTSEANAIAQTSEGFIWIGSYSGLLRYDGNTFERMDSTTGVSSVISLHVDQRDRLWVGTNESGLVIGGMEDVRYKEYEFMLKPGDKLFVYTDGVPEATAAGDVMFGIEKMVAALNKNPQSKPEQILKNVRTAVDDFVKDAEQFDDLTMLCMEYKGIQQ